MKTIAGTPFFLAPEIVRGKKYSAKIDIWSVGVITYQLLYGTTPFHSSKGFQELYQRIQNADFSFPAEIPISDAAKDFISSLLVVSPTNRPNAQQAMAHHWLQHHVPLPYWLLLKMFNHEADPTLFAGPTSLDIASQCLVLEPSFSAQHSVDPGNYYPESQPEGFSAALRTSWEQLGAPGPQQITNLEFPPAFYSNLIDSERRREELLKRLKGMSERRLEQTEKSGFVWPGAFENSNRSSDDALTPKTTMYAGFGSASSGGKSKSGSSKTWTLSGDFIDKDNEAGGEEDDDEGDGEGEEDGQAGAGEWREHEDYGATTGTEASPEPSPSAPCNEPTSPYPPPQNTLWAKAETSLFVGMRTGTGTEPSLASIPEPSPIDTTTSLPTLTHTHTFGNTPVATGTLATKTKTFGAGISHPSSLHIPVPATLPVPRRPSIPGEESRYASFPQRHPASEQEHAGEHTERNGSDTANSETTRWQSLVSSLASFGVGKR